MIAENRRVQLEKEKLMYDFENLQSQLDKALGQAARIQKERESVGLDSDRLREKADKAQVKSEYYLGEVAIYDIEISCRPTSPDCRRNATRYPMSWTATRSASRATRV